MKNIPLVSITAAAAAAAGPFVPSVPFNFGILCECYVEVKHCLFKELLIDSCACVHNVYIKKKDYQAVHAGKKGLLSNFCVFHQLNLKTNGSGPDEINLTVKP